MAKKITLSISTTFGSSYEYSFEVPKNTTQDEIEEMCEEIFWEHVEYSWESEEVEVDSE